jgi:Mrp family chromosome partitioning ATPase
VGIFDADIHGPSIPTLFNKEKESLVSPEEDPKTILPVVYEGIKVNSSI